MQYDEPILLIDVENVNGKQRFRISEMGENILLSIADKVVSVIGIAGPQRTGKSFLANTLINKMNGFSIGNSTMPCTKGIWIWGKPLVTENEAILILDTEGLHSVFRDAQIDAGILGITLLLSSVFVYNK